MIKSKKAKNPAIANRLPIGPGGGVQLLLIHNVEDLGHQGDVVEVRPGYALNYLIPQGLATVASDHHKRMVDKHRAKLQAIEKAIPRPLILELRHGGRARMAMAWKRPSQAEAGKWVTAPHALTAWQAGNTPREALPTVLDMATLYARLLEPMLPPRQSPDEPIAARVARSEEAAQLEREIARMEAGVRREKQFNRKVELNAELRAAKARYTALTSKT